jgi:predicted DNA-binding transcriptional regulator YafY
MANPFANSIKFLKAINLLASPRGATIKRIMENLNISRRSAFRLLQALEELGLPLTDGQSRSRTEKTYRLLDSYVLKLPNMVIPNPRFTGEEIELILAILDLYKQLIQIGEIPRLNAIREKIKAIAFKEDHHERKKN